MEWLHDWEFAKRLVVSQCAKVRSLLSSGRIFEARVRATRLWNVIDYCPEPRYLLCVMIGEVPEVFEDKNDVNSLLRAYGNWRVRQADSEEQFTGEAASPIQVAWKAARLLGCEVSDFVYWSTRSKCWLPVMRHGGTMISRLHCVPARQTIR